MITEIILATLVIVHDGDTFSVNIPNLPPVFGERIGVRLNGVDTPEINSKKKCERVLAQKAKEYTKSLIPAEVALHNCARDKYFRLRCDVLIGTKLLSDMLIENKFGVPYFGEKKTTKWCKITYENK